MWTPCNSADNVYNRKNMKTHTPLILMAFACAALLLCASGCFRDKEDEFSENFYVFRMAETHPNGFPTTLADNYFARLVNERSHGRITIKVYAGSKLGDEKSTIEQVQYGGIDFARVSVAPLTNFYSDLGVLSLPYIYENRAHQWEVLNGKVGHKLLSGLKQVGFYGLCYYDSGARSFYSTTPIRSISDIAGKRIRIQETKITDSFIRRLGAIPVPITYGESLGALQRNDIDGAENNWSSYETSGHHAVAQYYSNDEHSRTPEVVIASALVMDKLTLNDRMLILQCAQDSVMYQMEQWQRYEDEAKQRMLDSGIEYIEIAPDALTEFKKAAIRTYRELPPHLSNVLEEIFESGQKYRLPQ